MKKLIFLLLCMIIVFSSITCVYAYDPAKNEFSDIKGHWAEETINKMAGRGLINGVGNNLFQPDANMTRSQFAALLHKTLSLQIRYFRAPDINEVFRDVGNEAWYACILYDLVTTGIVDDKVDFRPESPITRQEIAHYIIKAYEYKKGIASSLEIVDLDKFKDKDKINPLFLEDFSKAVRLKLFNGKENGLLQPDGNITRAEVTVVADRFISTVSEDFE